MDKLREMLGFMTPMITFIANASFALLTFVVFILCPVGYGKTLASYMLSVVPGATLTFIILLVATGAAIALPLFTKKLVPCLNYNIGIVMFMLLLCFTPWNAVTIIWLILLFIPWMILTLAKTGEPVEFNVPQTIK